MSGGWHEGETGLLLREVLADLPRLSDAIAISCFAHSEISQAGRITRRGVEAEVLAVPAISIAENEGRGGGTVL